MRRRDAAAQWTPAPPSLENKIKDWLRLWNLGADGGRQIDCPRRAWTMFWAGSSNKPPSLPHSSWSKVSVDRASPTGLLSCSPNWRQVFLPLTLLNSLTSAASRVYRSDAGISFGRKITHLVTSNLTCWDFYYDLHRPSWHHVLDPRHKCKDYWIEEGAQLRLEFDYVASKTTNLRQVTQSLWGSVSSSVGMGIRRFILQSCSLWRLNNLWQKVKQRRVKLSLSCLYSCPFSRKSVHFPLVNFSFQCCLEFSPTWKHPRWE